MSIRIEGENEVGISFFDISTSKCFIGRFVDDNNFASFRTLISQVNPIEVLIEKDAMPN